MSATGDVVRRRLTVRGVVQGVGFRPFLARLADDLSLTGRCWNDATGVVLELQGVADVVAEGERRLVADAPPLARVVEVLGADADRVDAEAAFVIVASGGSEGPRTLVPPDTAVCPDCLAEMADPDDRRYRHPFISCTNCGPRLTIIRSLPYDRPATTMAQLPLCAACAAEYADPRDRRYHAQPIACHDCGPSLSYRRAGDGAADLPERPGRAGSDVALAAARQALGDGEIVAIKGLGGYHLACDAANPAAVQRLRDRKRRPDKPFALMAADSATAGALIDIDRDVSALLSGPEHPIVIAPRRDTGQIADPVAPGLDELGVVLPYTPVHHLLFAPDPITGQSGPQVLVMTSGNLGDEPLCYLDQDAFTRLGGIADGFLTNDRPIHVPCEDSLVAARDGELNPIRRSRGYAPLPLPVPAGPTVLAVGAEIKNTLTLARQDLAFVSAHLGDMGTIESQRAFEASAEQLLSLHEATPELLAADRHPGYATTALAARWGADRGIPVHLVQHHHAHLASLLAEHGRLSDPIIALAFDGTGYGCDGTIWGGEVLSSTDGVDRIQRVGHLQPFVLPGGDAAVRAPARIALSLLNLAGVAQDAGGLVPGLTGPERSAVRAMVDKPAPATWTTSLGRLFDGLAALCGLRDRVTYEAQAAVELEVLARSATASIELDMPVEDGVMNTAALVRSVVEHLRRGTDRGTIAAGIHAAVAAAAARAARSAADRVGVSAVGLTGGAFQNHELRQGIASRLTAAGYEVLTHERVPCTDGGLSLGQVVIARAAWQRTTEGVH